MKPEDIKNKNEQEVLQERAETPSVQESPEALSQKMTEQSQKEVADFQATGEKEIGNIEKTLEDGLVIDENDKTELKGLDREADEAKTELTVEITGEKKEWTPDSKLPPPIPQEYRSVMPPPLPKEVIDTLQEKEEGEKVKFCTNCGKPTQKSAKFCTECGNKIEQEQAENEWDPNGNEPPPLQEEYHRTMPPPIPEEYRTIPPTIPHKNVSLMKEREIEKPELLSKEGASKKFLAEERAKLAQEIWTQRNAQRERLSKLKNIIDVAQEKIESENGDKQVGRISELQSNEANLMANRLGSAESLSEKDAEDERGNIAQLISNSKGISSLKKKLGEFYAKADEIAKNKFETMQKTVEQTLLRNNVFIVHAIQVDERNRHNANSNISQRATIEDDMDILLSLEPSISSSSLVPGTKQGLWENSIGVVIGGGDIRGVAQTDNGTLPEGIDGRNGNVSTSQEIDEKVSDKSDRGYNELVVNNPKVFGFYQNVNIDESGKMIGFSLNKKYENKKDSQRKKEEFMNHMNLAAQKGMPLLIMTPDRKLFEFINIADDGTVSVGEEITPEKVALGKAGLSNEKRQEIGEEIISKNLFKNIKHQKEAKGRIAELSGQENNETELSREEYLAYAKDNPGRIYDFPWHLREEEGFMKEIAHFDPRSTFEYAGENLKRNIDFIKYIYSLGNEKEKPSIYGYMPEALKKDENIALLAIENDDFEKLDYSLADASAVWEKIIDKLVEKYNPSESFSSGEGNKRVKDTNFFMIDRMNNGQEKIVNVKEKIITDHNLITKLNEKYPSYKFEVNEYNELLVTKLN